MIFRVTNVNQFMNINFSIDNLVMGRSDLFYGHGTVKCLRLVRPKWFWKIIINLFQSRMTDFRFSWKQCHSSTSLFLVFLLIVDYWSYISLMKSPMKHSNKQFIKLQQGLRHASVSSTELLNLKRKNTHRVTNYDRDP